MKKTKKENKQNAAFLDIQKGAKSSKDIEDNRETSYSNYNFDDSIWAIAKKQRTGIIYYILDTDITVKERIYSKNGKLLTESTLIVSTLTKGLISKTEEFMIYKIKNEGFEIF